MALSKPINPEAVAKNATNVNSAVKKMKTAAEIQDLLRLIGNAQKAIKAARNAAQR